ncbi:MAG: bacterial proteasome activator family protein [Actinomycetia bacterium]|nr:bacterial proteasome activator family protein [Actinomycetes bacterium]
MTDDVEPAQLSTPLPQTDGTETPDPEPAADRGDSMEVTSMVEQPAKVMRIGTMIKQLLEEVRAAPLDEAGRQRLREIHETSIRELEDGLAPELSAELDRFTLPFGDDVPSEAELRIAQAQLVGWLEGLFHGIQTALIAQQMAARAQLEQMRAHALPGHVAGGGQIVIGPGGQIIAGAPVGHPGPAGAGLGGPEEGESRGTGQYL